MTGVIPFSMVVSPFYNMLKSIVTSDVSDEFPRIDPTLLTKRVKNLLRIRTLSQCLQYRLHLRALGRQSLKSLHRILGSCQSLVSRLQISHAVGAHGILRVQHVEGVRHVIRPSFL